MYDPSSGNKSTQKTGAAIAFIVLATASLFFMMWWGYGGYIAITPKGLHSMFVQILIYLCVSLIVVHGMFFWAKKITRKLALYGFLSPWVIVLLITIPQFFRSPGSGLLMILVPAIVFASNKVIEHALHNREDV
jgi:hypothetical protein